MYSGAYRFKDSARDGCCRYERWKRWITWKHLDIISDAGDGNPGMSANSGGYSFTISFFESLSGPGFRRTSGYVASWCPLYQGRGPIKITGSPFRSFEEAEAVCDAMLKNLVSE